MQRQTLGRPGNWAQRHGERSGACTLELLDYFTTNITFPIKHLEIEVFFKNRDATKL